MTPFLKAFGTVALMACAALPVAAATDVAKMTCTQFQAMDAPAKLLASTDLLLWIGESDNQTPGIADLIGKYTTPTKGDAWTADAMKTEIEGHCTDAPMQISVVERLMTHS
jgi:hypothetical protein